MASFDHKLPPWSRRGLLRAAGAVGALCAAAPRAAGAFGPASQPDIAELELPGLSLSRPAAWERLLYEVIQASSVDANPRSVRVAPEDPALFEHPFSVLVGDRALPPLSEAAIAQLQRYLSYGGFLAIDDASGDPSGPFAASVRALCARLFPTRPLAPLPADHSIYRAFFLLDRPYGRLARSVVTEGVTVGPITPLVFLPNDLSGALDRGPDGRPSQACVPGGEPQRREAIKLGVNLVLYSLTSNYKHDQAHVAELLRAGRLE